MFLSFPFQVLSEGPSPGSQTCVTRLSLRRLPSLGYPPFGGSRWLLSSKAPHLRKSSIMGKGDTSETTSVTPAYRSIMEEYGYEVGKVIGHGSYGTVYEAYYTKQKVMVAVKIISKKKASDDYLNKFLPREIQVMKVLRHKYLINFYQAIETTSRVYIILELAQGGDVLEWIQRYGACSETLAGKWFSQMALGIAYLHSKGIVHRLTPSLSAAGRDLKLENLLLDKRENVKISDFGFAKMVSSSQPVRSSPSYRQMNGLANLSQTYCGSFAYACPEILLGLPYNPFLSDTWSMGVILYTLVVAHLPFDDTNLKKLLRETQKEVTFPSNINISEECKNLIVQMLRQAAKRATILDVLKDPWMLKFQSEQPTNEIKLLEAMSQHVSNTNRHQSLEITA
ncbi:testis-specific serine/threonine-protein kinase 4 [Alexandromys fortis]|nr:testis-specific serine/threonine-protein kinase 4 [Microtus fortis]